MSQNKINIQGGQTYEAPAVEVVEIAVEQPVFQVSVPAYRWEEEI